MRLGRRSAARRRRPFRRAPRRSLLPLAWTRPRRLQRRRRISPRHWPIWRSMTDPLELSLVEAAAAIRTREVSSEELTRLCLGRIEEHERVVNAFLGSAKLQTY